MREIKFRGIDIETGEILSGMFHESENIKVIGNIHENAELLERNV